MVANVVKNFHMTMKKQYVVKHTLLAKGACRGEVVLVEAEGDDYVAVFFR